MMTRQEAQKTLNSELTEYIHLDSDTEKEAFWNRITHEATQRAEIDKEVIREAIADDLAVIRQRILALKEKIEATNASHSV